ncbi:hypothetical protein WCT84_15280, partial [Pectobacterium brasiliense]|uniref:hypothetical protein n=1 Tax=Pectobacterium brasiliense TaxID=180957 RepID=UPI0030190FAB
ATGLGPVGRRFESSLADQLRRKAHRKMCFFFACNLPSLAKALPNLLTRQGVVVPCDIVRYGA